MLGRKWGGGGRNIPKKQVCRIIEDRIEYHKGRLTPCRLRPPRLGTPRPMACASLKFDPRGCAAPLRGIEPEPIATRMGKVCFARASRLYRPRPQARPRGHGELLKLLRTVTSVTSQGLQAAVRRGPPEMKAGLRRFPPGRRKI